MFSSVRMSIDTFIVTWLLNKAKFALFWKIIALYYFKLLFCDLYCFLICFKKIRFVNYWFVEVFRSIVPTFAQCRYQYLRMILTQNLHTNTNLVDNNILFEGYWIPCCIASCTFPVQCQWTHPWSLGNTRENIGAKEFAHCFERQVPQP